MVDVKAQAEAMATGGLRDATKSVDKMHHPSALGQAIGQDIRIQLQAHMEWVDRTLDNVGSDNATSAPKEAVDMVRSIIARHCHYDLDTPQTSADPDCHTAIDSGLLSAWQVASNDPDTAVCKWLQHGAPASLSQIPEACGIFPLVGDEPECPLDQLSTDYDSFSNYAGVDDDDTASVEFRKHLGLKRLKEFDSIEETSHRSRLYNTDQVAFS